MFPEELFLGHLYHLILFRVKSAVGIDFDKKVPVLKEDINSATLKFRETQESFASSLRHARSDHLLRLKRRSPSFESESTRFVPSIS